MVVPGASLVPILFGLGISLATAHSPAGKEGWLQCSVGGGDGGNCCAVMVAEDGMWGHVGLRDTSGVYPCSWLSAAALLLSLALRVSVLHVGMEVWVWPLWGLVVGAASWLSIRL